MDKDREKEMSALDHFMAGEVAIVKYKEIPIQILLQKNGDNVRAAVASSPDKCDREGISAFISSHGGMTEMIKTALNALGVNQSIEKGSVVLKNVKLDASSNDVLSNFDWNKK